MKPFKFKFEVEGETMSKQTDTFTVTIKAAPPPPPPPAPFVVLDPQGNVLADGGTVALPDETVGVAVAGDELADVSGGTPPYSFAVTSGAVPDGMTLGQTANADGSVTIDIAGTPTTAGDASFALTISDSAGASVTMSARRSIA